MRDVDVFLFDEPLSNLDAKLRSELRVEIKRLHQRLGEHHDLRHPRPDRGDDARRPHRGHEGRRHPAARRRRRRSTTSPVNRFVAGFIGSPGDELPRGRARARRRRDRFAPATSRCRSPRYRFDKAAAVRPARSCSASGRSISAIGDERRALPFSREIEVEIVEPMGSDTLVWTKLGEQNLSFRVEAEKLPHGRRALADRLRPSPRLAVRRRERRPALKANLQHQQHGETTMDWSFQLYSARNFQPWPQVLQTLGSARLHARSRDSAASTTTPAVSTPSSTQNGLAMPTGHFSLELLENEFRRRATSPRRSASRLVDLSRISPPSSGRRDAAGWKRFGERLGEVGKTLSDAGLGFRLAQSRFRVQAARRRLGAAGPYPGAAPDIGWEMDVAWVIRGGADPLPMDRRATASASPPSTSRTSLRPARTTDEDGWADVGHGTVDWTALIKACSAKSQGRSTSSWSTTTPTTSSASPRARSQPSRPTEEQISMAKKLGVGIIGCGNISTAYFRLAPLFSGIEMRACADINMAAAKARAKEFSAARRDRRRAAQPTTSTSSST